MPAATVTAEDVIRPYVADIAKVAEDKPATTVEDFIAQLDTAVRYFEMAGINGHEDLDTAGSLLAEALDSDEADRAALLRRASRRLRNLPEMATEYREMVGD